MGFLRNAIQTISPTRLAAAMERESRQWIMRCPEGHEQSVWDAGGIRYLAAGNPTRLAWCPKCECATWQRLYKRGQRDELGKPLGKPTKDVPQPPRGGFRLALVIVSAVFLLLGVMYLFGVIASSVPSLAFSLRAERTTGVVESLVPIKDGRVQPSVRYEVGGQSHVVRGQGTRSKAACHLGQQMDVLYDPRHPEVARLDALSAATITRSIFGVLGAIFLAVGLVGMLLVKLTWSRQTTVACAVDSLA